VSDLEWQIGAACRTENLEIFYSGAADDVREAVSLCRRCPVRGTCLEAAVERGEWFGVWGGTTERERRRLIRNRSAREQAA
jgi:WhiB family redox-sensing transcriptional regulator